MRDDTGVVFGIEILYASTINDKYYEILYIDNNKYYEVL